MGQGRLRVAGKSLSGGVVTYDTCDFADVAAVCTCLRIFQLLPPGILAMPTFVTLTRSEECQTAGHVEFGHKITLP